MRTVNDNIIPVKNAASTTTAAIPASQLFSCAAQITATGSASGTLKFQASLDSTGSPSVTPPNWVDIPSATVSVSGAGVFLIPKTDICYQWIRLVYTNSGTGTISVIFQALGV